MSHGTRPRVGVYFVMQSCRRGVDRTPIDERVIASGGRFVPGRQEGMHKRRDSLPQYSRRTAEYVGIASHGLRPFPTQATICYYREIAHPLNFLLFVVAAASRHINKDIVVDFLLPIVTRRDAMEQVILILNICNMHFPKSRNIMYLSCSIKKRVTIERSDTLAAIVL